MPAPISFNKTVLGADTSNLTGTPWFVGDFAFLTVSIASSTGSASRYTIVGTNSNGLLSSLGTPSQTVPSNDWSIITTPVNQGLYGFSVTGFRWVNVFRDPISVSAASNTTVTFSGRW